LIHWPCNLVINIYLDKCIIATTHIVAHKAPSWIITTVIIACTVSALKKWYVPMWSTASSNNPVNRHFLRTVSHCGDEGCIDQDYEGGLKNSQHHEVQSCIGRCDCKRAPGKFRYLCIQVLALAAEYGTAVTFALWVPQKFSDPGKNVVQETIRGGIIY